jgi:signal transduction histidine kinase
MGQLTASVAHEVGHPIATARTNAAVGLRLLQQTAPDLDKVRDAFTCIVNDTNRARDIISGIRNQFKNVPPRRDLFEVAAAIDEVIALAQAQLNSAGVSVRKTIATDLPLVRADRVQVQQVVLNLILNAVDAMNSVADGPRELLISSRYEKKDGIVFAVHDSGPGLDQHDVERIFEPFYTTKSSGVGMGLAICRSIIHTHGGRIWAEANEPRGAIFRFTLPNVT